MIIKIIHIASFKGNVGDIFNHAGFYQLLDKIFDKKYTVEKVELRDFYYTAKNKKFFDKVFANYINTFDICVLGGGGFFDARWEDSSTGTTLDFSEDFIDEIKIPVVVNAMGYNEFPGKTNDIILKKFQNFIDKISSKNNWLITVRNDGSLKRLKYRYKKIEKVIKVPDNAFFTSLPPLHSNLPRKEKTETIGLCITNDLFSSLYNDKVTTDDLNQLIAKFVNKQAKRNRNFIFFPHIPNDINVINEVLKNIENNVKRNQIIIAPLNAISVSGVYQLANYYKQCDCLIGMRFHSLIMGINLHIPAISLAGHQEIESLFTELNMEKFCLKVNNFDIDNKLDEIVEVLLNTDEIEEKYKDIYEELNNSREKYYFELFYFFNNKKYSKNCILNKNRGNKNEIKIFNR